MAGKVRTHVATIEAFKTQTENMTATLEVMRDKVRDGPMKHLLTEACGAFYGVLDSLTFARDTYLGKVPDYAGPEVEQE